MFSKLNINSVRFFSTMLSEPTDISKESLLILWYVGLHPALNSKLNAIFVYTNVALYGFCMVLAVKGVLLSYNNDMFYMSECFQTCILMTHTIGKHLILQNQKTELVKFLDKKANFWKISDFDGDVYKNCVRIVNTVRFITRSFFVISLLTAFFFDLQPFTTGYLPTTCYVPEGWFNFLKFTLWYLSIVTVLCLPGTDLFFCSLVSAIIVQFKLLSHKFKNITALDYDSEKVLWKELKISVDYHNTLLKCCQDLNTIFRSVFVLQFGICIASCAVSVFIFMQPGSWANRLKFMQYFVFVMGETGFYCIPLEIAINTVQAVDNAVYNSKWFEITTTQFKKCLGIIINKAQKPLIFSGYGLIYMDLRTYVTIMKTVFSFYTYLQTMEKLSNK